MQHSQLAPPRPVTPHGILAQKLEALANKVDAFDSIDLEFKQELKAASQQIGRAHV